MAGRALAAPIDYSEVSLLVRAHESESTIVQEVSQRKLLHALTPQQEAALKKQGASDSLVQSLRRSDSILAAADATAFEARREQLSRNPAPAARANGEEGGIEDNLHVFDVSAGHPVNLSQWGGPNYEFAFNAPSRLDEGAPDALLIDNVGSFTHTATYLGAGRAEDSTTIFDRRNYVSIVDHSLARGMYIDRYHPVRIQGVPYTLYPVYAAGGVSLYYVGASGDSVKLAVITAFRRM